MVVLAQLNALIRALHANTKCQARLPTRRLEEEFCDASAASDDERNELNCRGTIHTDDFECQLICPGDVEDYDAVPLEYAGFCPVALVSGQGFVSFEWTCWNISRIAKWSLFFLQVLPGNRRIGFLRFEGRFFSPSTVDRAEQFGRNPRLFLKAIKKLTGENPCLLSLMDIQKDDEESIASTPIGFKSEIGTNSFDSQQFSSIWYFTHLFNLGIQTSIHAFDNFKDPEYKWNEWDLRKEALKKSNLKNNRTTSVQTEGEPSARIKMATGVQASAPIDAGVQAGKNDISTSTGYTRSFFVGLQGETNFPMDHIILDELACNTWKNEEMSPYLNPSALFLLFVCCFANYYLSLKMQNSWQSAFFFFVYIRYGI